jgi:hypothetical protein
VVVVAAVETWKGRWRRRRRRRRHVGEWDEWGTTDNSAEMTRAACRTSEKRPPPPNKKYR